MGKNYDPYKPPTFRGFLLPMFTSHLLNFGEQRKPGCVVFAWKVEGNRVVAEGMLSRPISAIQSEMSFSPSLSAPVTYGPPLSKDISCHRNRAPQLLPMHGLWHFLFLSPCQTLSLALANFWGASNVSIPGKPIADFLEF